MPCLILDTSTDQCLIALAEENQILAEEIFFHGNLLSNKVLPCIRSFIETHCQSPKNLSEIAIGIGPGSYTGTRLGVAVAKSLAFALQIPTKTFSSPLAFLPDCEGSFAFLMPTRSEHFFVLSGRISSSHISQRDASFLRIEELKRIEDVDFLIYASSDDMPPALKKKPHFLATPRLCSLCLYLSKKEVCSLENIELLYFMPPVDSKKAVLGTSLLK
jgi:tRNA threonylcarbamoyladenosine biosynthesis protein TsaB